MRNKSLFVLFVVLALAAVSVASAQPPCCENCPCGCTTCGGPPAIELHNVV